MAYAAAITKEVKKTVVTKVPDGVSLLLSQEEAQFLIDLVGKGTRGSHMVPDSIYRALREAGLGCSSDAEWYSLVTVSNDPPSLRIAKRGGN